MSDPHSLVAVDAAVAVLYDALTALVIDPSVSATDLPRQVGPLYRAVAVYQGEREKAKVAA